MKATKWDTLVGILGSEGSIGIKIVPLVLTFIILVFLLSFILKTYCKRCRKSDRFVGHTHHSKSSCFLKRLAYIVCPCCCDKESKRSKKPRKFHILRREQANQLPQFREQDSMDQITRRDSDASLSQQSSRVSSVYDFSADTSSSTKDNSQYDSSFQESEDEFI